MTLILPLTIGVPTAATPLNVPVVVLLAGGELLPPPPPQPESIKLIIRMMEVEFFARLPTIAMIYFLQLLAICGNNHTYIIL
jgi:hypothetical protein